jgi:hypothetical protein
VLQDLLLLTENQTGGYMISCNLRGGLGNVLFQVATTVSLALDNNDTCAFNLDSIVTMQGNPAYKYKDNVFSKLAELPKNWKSQSVITENNEPYKPIVYKENLLLDGYFQCDRYFNHNKDFITYLFLHIPTIDTLKREFRNILIPNSVSIHVRRGDYAEIGENIKGDYYYRALNKLWEVEDIGNILVFSDDIKWCKDNFLDNRDGVFYIEGLEDYEDLYLFSLCPFNICANSSFSWWGAYLNNNDNKRVYMPKPWTTSICDDIYPEGVEIIKYKNDE